MTSKRLRLLDPQPTTEAGKQLNNVLDALDRLSEELLAVRANVVDALRNEEASGRLEFLTDKQVAEMTQLSRATIRSRCKKGLYPNAFAAGGRAGWRIPRRSFDAVHSRATQPATPLFDVGRLDLWRQEAV